ncbi:MAG: hypothetical protein JXM68_12305 [Sedimentisphaerales bacterium]|nr:hypothetical protein [Sedimentisphaerales bacterium]
MFTFVIAFVLGVFCTLWALSPGDTKQFISDITEGGSLNISRAQELADWGKAEEKVWTGVNATKDKFSSFSLFSSNSGK